MTFTEQNPADSLAELSDESFKLPVIDSERVFHGAVWDVNRDQLDFGNGQVASRDFMHHPGAVAVAAINEQEEILLIKQYRHPVAHRLWELPAGMLDHQAESRAEAALRELIEETGYSAKNLAELGRIFASPGSSTESIWFFLATDLHQVDSDFELEFEEKGIESRWVPISEAVIAAAEGRIQNAIAVSGIFLTQQYLEARKVPSSQNNAHNQQPLQAEGSAELS